MQVTESNFVQTKEAPPRAAAQETIEPLLKRKRRRAWLRWLIALVVVVAAVSIVQYLMVPTVVLVRPETVKATETLALAGISEGRIETPVAGDAQGTVKNLYVRENAVVKKGQLLARIQDSVAQGQLEQANAALNAALAQQRKVQAGTQPSDIQAARARVDQAIAGEGQARAALSRARAGVAQANASIAQAEAGVRQARAGLAESQSRLELARKTLERTRTLSAEGALPLATYDQAASAYEVAGANVDSSKQLVSSADAALDAAQQSRRAAAEDVAAAQSGVVSANAVMRQSEAALKTAINQPRSEDLALANAQVMQARAALATAQRAVAITEVRAPFDGTVTQIVAEEGSPVTAGGVVQMVQSNHLQIRLDVDETNLADLRAGQEAEISSTAFPSEPMMGHVTKIFSRVDPTRGTVQVVVTPDSVAGWLRPGQTVDVNVVLRKGVNRLTVPVAAVRKIGDQTVVYVARNGHAVATPVETGLVWQGQIPVLSGLKGDDIVIRNAAGVDDGSRIRSRS